MPTDPIESPEAFAERLLRGIGDLDYIDCFEPGRSAQALADAADTIRADRDAVRREALLEAAAICSDYPGMAEHIRALATGGSTP